MKSLHHFLPNGEGWLLSLTQTWDPSRLVTARRPVLIVPGYGMNSFIFSYHPGGLSLEGWLANEGFEVWRVDLRNQGRAVSTGGSDDFAMEDLALTDLGVAIDAVLERTRTVADRVDVIGASLGGTLMFVHAALNPSHRMGSLVSLGSPVRWVEVHPAIRLAFVSPTLVGLVRLRGTRRMAELLLPLIARHTPWLLSIYMNPSITDTSAAREMVKTVEDPNRHINRQIARWIRQRDLVVQGVNVTERVGELQRPLLCVLAQGDGIVPASTAAFPYHQAASTAKELLVVGDDTVRMAHADLFVSREAHERVFRPLSSWLAVQNELPSRRNG